MRALLVYPECPDTFWSFKHALKFISKKAMHPPLGLLTVAAMLPPEWEKRFKDMNVEALADKDLEWADYVFLSAMVVQKESVKKIVSRCKKMGVKIVAGGPLFTTAHEDFEGIDHFVLNEAEVTLPPFLADVKRGGARKVYASEEFTDLRETPIPRWDLAPMSKYVSMNIQYSRGCPFDCEFCDIAVLYGQKVRTKTKEQILKELDGLYATGWRGCVFFVDDNFIGNKEKLRRDILPALVDWMEQRKHPFVFSTEVSINISDHEELMELMVRAGFDGVFVGIETPDEECLAECGKSQNKDRDLVACVKKIQKSGLEVRGGFIVGFDHDSHSIFQRQIDFIQRSRIITAMVGILNAPRGTRLYRRMAEEGRLLEADSGDNTDFTTNIVPKMGRKTLAMGYRKIIDGIYSAKPYYDRVKCFLREHRPLTKKPFHIHPGHIRFHFGYAGALFKSIWSLGIRDKERVHFWRLLLWSLFRRPSLLPQAITYAIYGHHFRKVFQSCL